jgi:fermentation-respiration switch protein FrsA (DUF1100 family)
LLARFSAYRFPAVDFLNRLRSPVPVLALHGDDDRVVPIREGRALFGAITAPKRFFTIQGGDHNDAQPPDPETYWSAVGEFVESLAPIQAPR